MRACARRESTSFHRRLNGSTAGVHSRPIERRIGRGQAVAPIVGTIRDQVADLPLCLAISLSQSFFAQASATAWRDESVLLPPTTRFAAKAWHFAEISGVVYTPGTSITASAGTPCANA